MFFFDSRYILLPTLERRARWLLQEKTEPSRGKIVMPEASILPNKGIGRTNLASCSASLTEPAHHSPSPTSSGPYNPRYPQDGGCIKTSRETIKVPRHQHPTTSPPSPATSDGYHRTRVSNTTASSLKIPASSRPRIHLQQLRRRTATAWWWRWSTDIFQQPATSPREHDHPVRAPADSMDR